MFNRIFRIMFAVIGAILGISVIKLILSVVAITIDSSIFLITINVLGALIFAVLFYFLSGVIFTKMEDNFKKLEKYLDQMPPMTVAIGISGLIVGLILAFLATRPLTSLTLPIVGNSIFVLLSIIIYVGFGLLGWRIASRYPDKYPQLFQKVKDVKLTKAKSINQSEISKDNLLKVIDTSVLIDGRILDIIKINFLEGKLVIPEFVLEELQHIADSPDDLKRERGRRGLDVVKEIKKDRDINLEISSVDYPDIKEVDSKLLKYAQDTGAKIFTNDYNLNKVADVQGITVLNINDLANALKTKVLPGESMEIEVIKEGKSRNQGVGYLEDGTMVVVEDGKHLIGQHIRTTVTSVLQTSAGKMIFVKAKE
ncbi:PIN/TRAM domain-containing protein [Anaerococcus sp. AGMB00486]|uniref:PIN/TRAM domain-containing protein n=1 Tax=Anaerococcus faecalis TaxID=2742993 RepID=A0ABX2NCL5_9FIRM|nr:PIN domain-containing protein [Anaerococcus faecalis]NVF12207.1 PIN/TRAM domain-containing protein [Anaerococcus faecalis]